jgi:DNA helicase-2/ATP-dependent DNA helicase PcrA
LFYVAVTRAEKKLYLSFAENRFIWGQYTFCEPSRFLDEIDSMYLDDSEVLEKTSLFERVEAYQTYNKPKQFLGSNFKKVDSGRFDGVYPEQSRRTQRPERALSGVEVQKPKGLVSMDVAQRKSVETHCVETHCNASLQENQRVFHEKFGNGLIKSVEQNGEKIVVFFDSAGEKTLLTKFAKLKLL